MLDYLISVSLHRTVSLDIYAAYILFNVCVLSNVCLSLYVFVCFVFFMFYGLKPEINAFIHSFKNLESVAAQFFMLTSQYWQCCVI